MRRLNVVFISACLAGCGGGDGNGNGNSSIVGTWITEKCEQALDANGDPQTIWGRGLYEFTGQGVVTLDNVTYANHGQIKTGRVIYEDSNCEIVLNIEAPAVPDQPVLYQDLGEVILQEGLPGHELAVIVPMPGSLFSVNGFYTINNGTLCFSHRFDFQPFQYGFDAAGSTAIDFGNCLSGWVWSKP